MGAVWLKMKLFWQLGMLVMLIFAPFELMCMILFTMFVVPLADDAAFAPLVGLGTRAPFSPAAPGAAFVFPTFICFSYSAVAVVGGFACCVLLLEN